MNAIETFLLTVSDLNKWMFAAICILLCSQSHSSFSSEFDGDLFAFISFERRLDSSTDTQNNQTNNNTRKTNDYNNDIL